MEIRFTQFKVVSFALTFCIESLGQECGVREVVVIEAVPDGGLERKEKRLKRGHLASKALVLTCTGSCTNMTGPEASGDTEEAIPRPQAASVVLAGVACNAASIAEADLGRDLEVSARIQPFWCQIV